MLEAAAKKTKNNMIIIFLMFLFYRINKTMNELKCVLILTI